MLGDKKVEMFKSPKALADVLNQFPGYPDDVPDREFNCPNCPKKISWSCSCGVKKRKNSSPEKEKLFCKNHGKNSTHDTANCRLDSTKRNKSD